MPSDTQSPLQTGPRWFHLAPWLLLLLCAWLALERAALVDQAYASYASCPGCFRGAVLAADAQLFAAVALLLGLGQLLRLRAIGFVLGALATLLVLAYAVDLLVFRILAQRLYLFDFLKFSKEVRASWSVAHSLLSSASGIRLVSVCALAAIATTLLWPWRRSPRRGRILLAAAAPLAAWSLLWPVPDYIHTESYQNVVQVNLPSGVDRPFSPEFRAGLAARPKLEPACEPGRSQRPDIIVFAAESLSAYHSRLTSGMWDSTPKLDRLAQGGAWFSNFYANGFHTDGGLISIFAGRVPSPGINRYRSLEAYTGFEHPQNDFFAALKRNGYSSHFFTSGTLEFLHRGEWLATLGFQQRDGADDPYYDGMRRWQFGAAEDSALVGRFLEWYDQRKSMAPFFAGVLTVTSHPPFIEPRSGHQDEAATFRYVDEQAAALHDALEARGFFKHGLLIVLGDHRSMTPLKPGEYEHYGESAYARIPVFVFGASGLPPGRIDQPFQQTDLVPSILRLVDASVCRLPTQGAFLGGSLEPPRYILHAGGLHRDQIEVYAGTRASAILLDGDRTRWLGTPPPDADALIAEVDADRAARGALRENLLDFFIQAFTGKAPSEPAPAKAPASR